MDACETQYEKNFSETCFHEIVQTEANSSFLLSDRGLRDLNMHRNAQMTLIHTNKTEVEIRD